MPLGLIVTVVNFAIIAVVVLCGTLIDGAAERSDATRNDGDPPRYK